MHKIGGLSLEVFVGEDVNLAPAALKIMTLVCLVSECWEPK